MFCHRGIKDNGLPLLKHLLLWFVLMLVRFSAHARLITVRLKHPSLTELNPSLSLSLSCVKQVRFEAPVLLMSNEANQPNPVMMTSSETRPPRWRSGPLLFLSHMIHWGVWYDWLTVLYRFYPNHKPPVHSKKKNMVLHKYIKRKKNSLHRT